MSVRVFISHSSENQDFADLAYEVMHGVAGIEVLIDSRIEPGEAWEHAIRSFVNKADVLLVVVSQHSLVSKWVQFECLTFLARAKETPDLEIIPILLDDSRLPDFLVSFEIDDFRIPERYREKLERLATRIRDRRLAQAENIAPDPLLGGGVKASAELKRMEEMILNAVNRGVTDLNSQVRGMFEIFQKQQYLLTPQAISLKEKTATSEIWVVTTHLYNDTQDPEIRESVKANLARGIDYKYFVDTKKTLINRRIPEYQKHYSEYSNRYEFIPLPAGLIM